MATIIKNLGPVTAYKYAVQKGYTGTEEEFAELMASYADVAEEAAESAAAAAASATAASGSASTASTKASEAAGSASAAAGSASAASTKASEAAGSATAAAGSASTASTKAGEAATSATAAAGSATTAGTKASEAASSASAAASSKTAAQAAQTAAETAQTAAETAQGEAEDAAASVSESAAQIATNAADISQLKSDFADLDSELGVYASEEKITSLDATYNRTMVAYPIKNVNDTFVYHIQNKSTDGLIAIRICSSLSPYAAAVLKEVRIVVAAETEALGQFTIDEADKATAKYIILMNGTANLLVPFTVSLWTGGSSFGYLDGEAVQYRTALDFCLESLANYDYTRIKKNTGAIETTADNLICSGTYLCKPGDVLKYKLSSDNAVFVTYNASGAVQTIVNGTGYNNYISGTYTFTSNDKFFAVSGSKTRYEAGNYDLEYTSKYKRYEQIASTAAEVPAIKDDVSALQAKTSRLSAVEIIKPNDVYYNGNLVRRCYNPYKNEGNLCLVGQLHCHTVGTASGETQYCTPAELCQLYKNNGYDFMTITDYGFLETYGGYSAHPDSLPSEFVWLFDSQECAVPSGNGYAIKHICMYNSKTGLTFDEYKSLQDVINTYQPQGMICSLAHPMWTNTYFSPAQIKSMVDTGLRFCEIYDGLTHTNNAEQYPAGSDTDFAWEAMLDKGLFVFGIAISDSHTASTVAELKNGCVKVFCNSLSRYEILKNLCLGNFYASTDSDSSLESVSVVDGLYSIDTGDASAATVFMKENGTVLSTVTGATASYQITGAEQYVRAKVTLSSGAKIWTQPVFNIIDDLYNDYTEFMDF